MVRRILRLTLVEFSKLRCQKFIYLALIIILLTVVLTVVSPKLITPAENAELETPAVVNGFEPMVKGCLNGFKIAVLFLLIFGSLMISNETNTGTLRMVLGRPFRRSEFFLAKGLTLVLIALLIAGLIQVISLGLAGYLYGFTDIMDPTYPDYEPYALKAEMFRYTFYSVVMFLIPLISVAFLGLFISTLIENTGVAVAVAILLYLPLDYLVIGLFDQLAPYIFNNYLDYYFVTFQDMTGTILEESWRFKIIDDFLGVGQTGEEAVFDSGKKLAVLGSLLVPFIYIILFSFISLFIFKKKDVLV